MSNPIVWFDITYGSRSLGRIEFELFAKDVPRTAENFRSLCTGERGISASSGKPLHYRHSSFHRIINGFMAQGGDFTAGNGTGGESIYGGKFQDENFIHKHRAAGLLCMANSGPNTNGSQFFITFRATPHLDGKHVVFGKVISGMEVVNVMEMISTDSRDKPKQPVVIADCGQTTLAETRQHGDQKLKEKIDEKRKREKKEKKEKKKKDKKAKKDSKRHDKKDSKKSKSKSEDRDNNRSRDMGKGGEGIDAITAEDYFMKSEHFRCWLKLLKDISFDNLTSERSHELFEEFVKKYNSRKLPSMYYQKEVPIEVRDMCIKTVHKW